MDLTIGSYNVDTLRTVDSIDALLHNLKSNNVDISCIQETHKEKLQQLTMDITQYSTDDATWSK